MSENGEIYTAGKNFTLPTAVTNSTSGKMMMAVIAINMLTGKMTMISLQVPLAMPQRVKLEAHDVILDFIRSRPPLKPVSFWGKIMPAPNRMRFIEGLLSNR